VQYVPTGWVAAVALAGSGDPNAEKARGCALNECVVQSSKAGIFLDGVGCRLLARQCLIVTGEECLRLHPGTACKGKANMQCVAENVTFATRTAVLRLGDAPTASVVREPIFMQARDCAYLHPFQGRPGRAGLLLWEGDALARGLLLWQSERDGFDHRLHFAAAPVGKVPEKKEGYRPWLRMWGSGGTRETRSELGPPLKVLDPRRWRLDHLRLAVPEPPGANLDRLGIRPPMPR
jgi:hypothetical protein